MLKIEKLSEKNLAEVLEAALPDAVIRAQRRITVCDKLMIVDYEVILDNKVFYVEFDGPTHYTNPKTQIRDIILEEYCDIEGIKLVRIPYYLQPGPLWLAATMEVNIPEYTYDIAYRSGFIDTKIVYPGTFNSRGSDLFVREMSKLKATGFTGMLAEVTASLEALDPEISLGIGWRDRPYG